MLYLLNLKKMSSFQCGKKDDNMIEEKKINNYPEILDLGNAEKVIFQMKNNICRINLLDGAKGTGFFCLIPFPDNNNIFRALITNNNIIGENILYNIKKINISINNFNEDLILQNRILYTRKDYDITIIQIKEEDNINYFLELDNNILNNYSNIPFVKSSIYIIQFPGHTDNPGVSHGIIDSIENVGYTFLHSCSTEEGSSGSPILNSKNKVIGIHRGSLKNKNFNYGTFMNFLIQDRKKFF